MPKNVPNKLVGSRVKSAVRGGTIRRVQGEQRKLAKRDDLMWESRSRAINSVSDTVLPGMHQAARAVREGGEDAALDRAEHRRRNPPGRTIKRVLRAGHAKVTAKKPISSRVGVSSRKSVGKAELERRGRR